MTIKLTRSDDQKPKPAVRFSSLNFGDTFYLEVSPKRETRCYFVKVENDLCVCLTPGAYIPINISSYLQRTPDTLVIPVDITLSIETSDTI